MAVTNESTHSGANDSEEFRLNNPHLFPVSHEQFITDGVLITVFAILGILANSLVFWTLFKKNRSDGVSSLSLFLQCLSGYDTIVAILAIWMYSIPALFENSAYMSDVHPYLIPYLFPVRKHNFKSHKIQKLKTFRSFIWASLAATISI